LAGTGAWLPLAGVASGVTGPLACSTTLFATGRSEPRYAKPRLVAKNNVARTAVERDRKLAEPLAPNTVAEAPEPKAAPVSAPLPRCTSTSPMIIAPMTTCTMSTKV